MARTPALDKKALLWKVVSMGCGTAAGLATERLIALVYQKAVHDDPPTNPADRRTSWPAALGWAVATGVAVSVSRLVASCSAARVWEAAIDEAPPGIVPEKAA